MRAIANVLVPSITPEITFLTSIAARSLSTMIILLSDIAGGQTVPSLFLRWTEISITEWPEGE